MKYNDYIYKEFIEEAINDIFYIEGVSIRTKIAKIRQYTEIIVRYILDINNTKPVTLGNPKIINKLKVLEAMEMMLVIHRKFKNQLWKI